MNLAFARAARPTNGLLLLQRIAVRSAAALLLGLAALDSAAADATLRAAAVTSPVIDTGKLYRPAGARHLYDTHRARIFKGQLPPLLYAIAIIDVDIDQDGNVVSAVVDREPASAKEVMPWILGLIRAASPFPKPGVAGLTRYRDIWLVDHSYTFQLDTLTEGQR